MAFYFALFNVSNANLDVRDEQIQQHEYYLRARNCRSSVRRTSLQQATRRRHSLASSRDVFLDYRLLPRPTVLLPSTNTSRSNREAEWRRLSSPLTAQNERHRCSLRPVSPPAIVAASSVFHHNIDENINELRKPPCQDLSSVSSTTKTSSSSSSTCSSSTSAQKQNYSLPPKTMFYSEKVKETKPLGSGFFRSKRDSFKQIFRRNSATASFERHKIENVDYTNQCVTPKSGLLRSPNPKNASPNNMGTIKKVQFMPCSMSTSLISSPVTKQQEEKPRNSNSQKIRKHERKLSADDISFLDLGDLNEWNVKAVILPPRNSRSRKGLIEIVPSPKLRHSQVYAAHANDAIFSNKQPKEIHLPDHYQAATQKSNCSVPSILPHDEKLTNLSSISQNYVRNSSIRRAKSSRAPSNNKTISKISETLTEKKERRRRHSVEGTRKSPPIITITTSNDEVISENKQSPDLKTRSVKFTSDTKRNISITNEKPIIRRRSTSDHNELKTTRDDRRDSDQILNRSAKINVFSEKEKRRWNIQRFKQLFSDNDDYGKNSSEKQHSSPSIRRHFSAMSHSAAAITAPEAMKKSLVNRHNF